MRKTPRRPRYNTNKKSMQKQPNQEQIQSNNLPIDTSGDVVELDAKKIMDIIDGGYPLMEGGSLFNPKVSMNMEKPFIVFGTDVEKLDYTGIAMAKTAGYEVLSKFMIDQLNNNQLAGRLYAASSVIVEDRYMYFLRLLIVDTISKFCEILYRSDPTLEDGRAEEFYSVISEYIDNAIIRCIRNAITMSDHPISDWLDMLQHKEYNMDDINIKNEMNIEVLARTSDLINECYNVLTLIAYRYSPKVADSIYVSVTEKSAQLFVDFRNTLYSILVHIMYECVTTYRIGVNNILENTDKDCK